MEPINYEELRTIYLNLEYALREKRWDAVDRATNRLADQVIALAPQ